MIIRNVARPVLNSIVVCSDKSNLSDYQQSRDPATSPEPFDDDTRPDWAGRRPFFVIQQHDASNLHYDFRLEVDGVLKSWAVPKGPSTDPSEKRLAMQVEDHPRAYADFEGTIPEDEYGGGTVIVWDRGAYRNLKDNNQPSVADQYDDGHITVWLDGKKITGGYALVRTSDPDEDNIRWLLIKMDDDEADARRNPVSTEPKSVKSGLTLEEVRKQASKKKDADDG